MFWNRPSRHCLIAGLLTSALLAGCTGPSLKPTTSPAATTDTPVSWNSLPPTSDTELSAGFAAWRAGCVKLKNDAAWAKPCQAAAGVPASPAAIRDFLQTQMDVYALGSSEGRQGLITGYYEPVYPGSLTRTAKATVPVYAVPDDLIVVALDDIYPELKGKRLRGRLKGRTLVPYDAAATIASNGAKSPAIAWLTSPMDLQFLQIQGSGRVQLANGRQLRLAYADQNGRPYRAIGKWLVEQGELTSTEVSMQSIRAWASAHPARIAELLASNPSYVFFERKPDSNEGPSGSLNVPLSAGYSVAVDRRAIPLGSLVWLSTTTPDGLNLVRPVAAQDTGGAIAGTVRADLFLGTGDAAGELAGRMKQSGRLWLLWPKGVALPGASAR
ncbi:murein transglycosylase A [Dyella tabacisoli]|uniref:murein transglycosylase A n=1 Tax=Dyella tabacisoli TaxID=2282381 RepID=UPI0036079CFB